ncbi:hypothetical protein [Bosea sp. (in: a-proteobacteria)]|uniref:hypothetical protein n=1 Tax=Bosea sp. (in: a-proteobacteria) TaxID=1871050 RepID=UPI00086F9572|nr:hypothetical protein [Bosea sp. (in: a-proteobacteria)]MBN9439580.1 hypothetical protein [Bosea sp. (in: a-proteobacteria)]MBN9468483.1 hypothetical protein [Bosea sp. (in: a-proteobacteria)]ODT53609.1 MAG: hypothetical protein ABS59_06970 [Methylobacterium sp. SCN 67-24]
MNETVSTPVTLTKMCELHGIGLPRGGALVERFEQAFPSAGYDDVAGEWRMVWKKGTYAESNARLEAFFTENGVAISHVDKC